MCFYSMAVIETLKSGVNVPLKLYCECTKLAFNNLLHWWKSENTNNIAFLITYTRSINLIALNENKIKVSEEKGKYLLRCVNIYLRILKVWYHYKVSKRIVHRTISISEYFDTITRWIQNYRMLNPIASSEAIYSATYVDNYIDSVENLPDDVQRHLSRIRDIDVQYRGKVLNYFAFSCSKIIAFGHNLK